MPHQDFASEKTRSQAARFSDCLNGRLNRQLTLLLDAEKALKILAKIPWEKSYDLAFPFLLEMILSPLISSVSSFCAKSDCKAISHKHIPLSSNFAISPFFVVQNCGFE
jgi:hypothetical protein